MLQCYIFPKYILIGGHKCFSLICCCFSYALTQKKQKYLWQNVSTIWSDERLKFAGSFWNKEVITLFVKCKASGMEQQIYCCLLFKKPLWSLQKERMSMVFLETNMWCLLSTFSVQIIVLYYLNINIYFLKMQLYVFKWNKLYYWWKTNLHTN